MARRNKILLIDDDRELAELVSAYFAKFDLELKSVHHGTDGFEVSLKQDFSVIVVDWNLPGMEGIDICRRLRSEKPSQPIIMLTSRNDEVDRILGLEMGADDYLTKPFSPRELAARVKALLRRSNMVPSGANSSEQPMIELGSLVIDLHKRNVTRDGESIELTAKEFDLLAFLASESERVFTRGQLLEEVWGYSGAGYENVVTSFISRLRRKLEIDPQKPQFIRTVHGVGYKLFGD